MQDVCKAVMLEVSVRLQHAGIEPSVAELNHRYGESENELLTTITFRPGSDSVLVLNSATVSATLTGDSCDETGSTKSINVPIHILNQDT